MKKNDVSTRAGAIVMLTVEGRLAIAADALAVAEKTRNEERRKHLCEKALRQLRLIVQS